MSYRKKLVEKIVRSVVQDNKIHDSPKESIRFFPSPSALVAFWYCGLNQHSRTACTFFFFLLLSNVLCCFCLYCCVFTFSRAVSTTKTNQILLGRESCLLRFKPSAPFQPQTTRVGHPLSRHRLHSSLEKGMHDPDGLPPRVKLLQKCTTSVNHGGHGDILYCTVKYSGVSTLEHVYVLCNEQGT